MADRDKKRESTDDDYFSYQASKFKPKLSYPDSKMRVYTKPDPEQDEIKVEESTASDSMIVRVIKAWKGEN